MNYEYKTENASYYPSIAEACNAVARSGWRVVTVIPAPAPGFANTLLLERERGTITNTEDRDLIEERRSLKESSN